MYIGKSDDLTLDQLQQVAALFAQRSAAPSASTPPTEVALPHTATIAGLPRDPLVMTKLALPPSLPALVPRPRLTDRLQDGLQRKLTLIAAPAGYGKTTLVAQWLRRNEKW